MKPSHRASLRPSLLCTAAAALMLGLGSPALLAEQPAPAVSDSTGVHRLIRTGAAALQPAAPEPPQATANTTPLRDDLFAGTEKFAKNATEANEVNMDPEALNIVGGAEAARAHRTLLNVVHHYEYDKPGMYNMAEVDEFRHKLDGPDWHCSVHSRDLKTGESTDICSRRRAPDLIERAIITVEPKELTFIHSIQKANGQGGSLDPNGTPDFSMMPGVTGSYFAAAMGAELRADMLASTARMRAEMPAFQHQMRLFQKDPTFKEFGKQKDLLKLDPHAGQQLKELQKHLELNGAPDPQLLLDLP